MDAEAPAPEAPPQTLRKIPIPAHLGFMMQLHPYKVAHGGRYGLKCLALGTKIIMADGTLRAVERVRKGDRVMGPDSKPRRVLETGVGSSKLYRIKQAFAMDYVVNAGHILSLKKSNSAKIDKRPMPSGNLRSPKGRYPGPDIVNITVEEYMAKSERWRAHFRGYRAGCLSFPDAPVNVDPYLLGIWLGDGSSARMEITSADPEVLQACREIAVSFGGNITATQSRSKALTIRLPVMKGRLNVIWQGFKAYNLPNNKHIPQAYLINSEETRLQLLAGLLDSDGAVHHTSYVIHQTRKNLAKDIKRLADTLGFRTSFTRQPTICTNNGVRGVAWRVSIGGDTWRIPCRVPHKQINKANCPKKRDFLLSGLEIEDAGVGRWAGFRLDGDGLFLLEDGTVTHNTRTFVRALLALGAKDSLRILCCREVMTSLKDSVHQEIKDQIIELGLGGFYIVLENEIRGANGTRIIYAGLGGQTSQSIKSYANIDICWVEEAQNVRKASWDILLPTIRKTNAEIWVSFNPDMDSDDTWVRWVENPLPGTVCVKTGWQDAAAYGWFPEQENQKRLHLKRTQPEDYENIWEGMPRTVVAGAIYTREIVTMVQEQRLGRFPYDPRYPVHAIWDLGWNDAMVVIMVQKTSPQTINVINYREVSGQSYDQVVGDLERLGYRWGFDWLPHDAEQHHPTSGTNAKKTLIGLQRQVKIIDRSDPEARIRAARMMFPRVFIDNSERKCEAGYLGAARLAYCLKRYKRNVPKTTGEPMSPTHDFASHAADAFGALAEIVEQIRSEFETPLDLLPGYTNVDPSMGTLG